jgi:hypothetical protein
VLLGEPLGDRDDLRARLLHRDARLRATDHVDARMVAAPLLSADLVLQPQERREDVGRLEAAMQAARHDADHGEGLAAQGERPAEHAGVAAEAPLPESLAEQSASG